MALSEGDQISELIIQAHLDALDEQGITVKKLACLLKQELSAKETKIIKVKGIVPDEDDIPHQDKGGKRPRYRTLVEGSMFGESVIAVDMINWPVRQNARMDAQKLLNLYPARKIEVAGKDGKAIPVAMTNFPPMPATIDEWQRQVEEAEKLRLQRQNQAGEDTGSTTISHPGPTSQAENPAGGQ